MSIDAGLSLLHPHAANHLMDGRIPGRSGNAHPKITPYDTFATATEKIFLAVQLVREGVPRAPIQDVATALAGQLPYAAACAQQRHLSAG